MKKGGDSTGKSDASVDACALHALLICSFPSLFFSSVTLKLTLVCQLSQSALSSFAPFFTLFTPQPCLISQTSVSLISSRYRLQITSPVTRRPTVPDFTLTIYHSITQTFTPGLKLICSFHKSSYPFHLEYLRGFCLIVSNRTIMLAFIQFLLLCNF